MTLDHLRLIRENQYRNRCRARIAAAMKNGPATVIKVHVLHEHDDSCCKVERWPLTAAKVWDLALADASGKKPEDVSALLSEHEPSIILADNSSRAS